MRVEPKRSETVPGHGPPAHAVDPPPLEWIVPPPVDRGAPRRCGQSARPVGVACSLPIRTPHAEIVSPEVPEEHSQAQPSNAVDLLDAHTVVTAPRTLRLWEVARAGVTCRQSGRNSRQCSTCSRNHRRLEPISFACWGSRHAVGAESIVASSRRGLVACRRGVRSPH